MTTEDPGQPGSPPPPPPPPQPPEGQSWQAPPQGWQAPPQYGYPPQGYAPPPSTNGMAVASMVLGILWLYWIGSILALVFGYIAKRQIDESRGGQGGRGMAVAGIVLGWIGVGILLLFLVFGVMFGAMGAFAA